MRLKLKCNKCGNSFPCTNYTTKLRGPIVLITCTDCGETYERSFSAFVGSQFEDDAPVISKARGMIELAQDIVGRVGEQPAYDKRKKD